LLNYLIINMMRTMDFDRFRNWIVLAFLESLWVRYYNLLLFTPPASHVDMS
jgi:hypothetical protein